MANMLHQESFAASEGANKRSLLKIQVAPAKMASATVLFFVSVCANATDFTFLQTGFTGGGTITGSFTASDLKGDGQISSFSGEVTAFSLSFSGDSLVQAFRHEFSNLYGLVYDLGSGSIGDGTYLIGEGIASKSSYTAQYTYDSGLGPLGSLGGKVSDSYALSSSESPQLVAVSVVPEPLSFLMLLCGLPLVLRRITNDA